MLAAGGGHGCLQVAAGCSLDAHPSPEWEKQYTSQCIVSPVFRCVCIPVHKRVRKFALHAPCMPTVTFFYSAHLTATRRPSCLGWAGTDNSFSSLLVSLGCTACLPRPSRSQLVHPLAHGMRYAIASHAKSACTRTRIHARMHTHTTTTTKSELIRRGVPLYDRQVKPVDATLGFVAFAANASSFSLSDSWSATFVVPRAKAPPLQTDRQTLRFAHVGGGGSGGGVVCVSVCLYVPVCRSVSVCLSHSGCTAVNNASTHGDVVSQIDRHITGMCMARA